jgi:adenylate cyclase
VVEHAGPHLQFDRIGEITLKGFTEPTEMFLARAREDGD